MVFENVVLRLMFEPKREEVTAEWSKLLNEELNDLYCSSNIVRFIKSRRMWFAVHVARMGESRGAYRVGWVYLRERDYFEDSKTQAQMKGY